MKDWQLKELVSSCLKKMRYSNEQAALEAINKVRKDNRNTPLKIYYCKHCLGYHLTSKIGKRNRYENNKRTNNKCITR